MAEDSAAFLAQIPALNMFTDAADLSRYQPLPEGWSLAMADVVSSGQAIAAGRYKAVNMAAASVITAVLNAGGLKDWPFVFGGDGAALAIPPEAEAVTREALAAVATWIAEEMGLTMRVAIVPVATIRAEGHDVQVARFRVGERLSFAMFSGGGSAWAEARMKAGEFAVTPAPPGTRPDLTGLSCRWNPIPARRGQIVSLIVMPTGDSTSEAFRALVAEIVGLGRAADGSGNPLPPEGPEPVFNLNGVEDEVRARAPIGSRLKPRIVVITGIVLVWLLHRLRLKLGSFNARDYVREVAANTDFRKFDDGLKMTVDIDDAALARIETQLATAAAAGICRYGLHKQDSALLTCFVPSLASQDHMHFVDGAGGGYAQAAMALKAGYPA